MRTLMSEVTRIQSETEQSDTHAPAQLLPLVYEELRKLAAKKLALEKPGQTLDPTALVHEAYLRLVRSPAQEPNGAAFSNREHFFRVAAEAMRRILIDRARAKSRRRRRGQNHRLTLSDAQPATAAPANELLALNEALERFAAIEPVNAELVKLRYFAGLSEVEAAKALGVSRATASRYWTYARAWLIDALDRK
jgi:RNA polymerase sigma factor (TIGR02999 family)